MNYVRHLNAFLELVASRRPAQLPATSAPICPCSSSGTRASLPDKLSVCRSDVMEVCKIGSAHTYYKCMKELHEFGYLVYHPSNNPLRGSVVTLHDLGESDLSEETGQGEKDDESDPGQAKKPDDFLRKTPVRAQVRHEHKCSVSPVAKVHQVDDSCGAPFL
ncbi:MAG: hypothetical protein U5K79_14955 [Cyclobacteriaceae bacterium]|nr:hypothetical protein [Cyclobacteriaceae bacterium]